MDINNILNLITSIASVGTVIGTSINIYLTKKNIEMLNKPNFNIYLDGKNGLIKLVVENNGNGVAKNFNIKFNEKFLEELNKIDTYGYRGLINYHKGENRTFGSGQYDHLFICSHLHANNIKEKLLVEINYEYNGKRTYDNFVFDINSTMQGILLEKNYIEEIAKNLENICIKIK